MAAGGVVRGVGRRSRRLFDIFVADVPWTVSSRELKEYFSQFGAVQRCQLPFDRDTGFHRRYCWIKFSTPEDVQNVFQKDSHILEGAKVPQRSHTRDQNLRYAKLKEYECSRNAVELFAICNTGFCSYCFLQEQSAAYFHIFKLVLREQSRRRHSQQKNPSE